MIVGALRERSIAGGSMSIRCDLADGAVMESGVTVAEVENLVAYQTGAFAGICALAGCRMTHVKTHGALGNAQFGGFFHVKNANRGAKVHQGNVFNSKMFPAFCKNTKKISGTAIIAGSGALYERNCALL
jgi:hypothetical protein